MHYPAFWIIDDSRHQTNMEDMSVYAIRSRPGCKLRGEKSQDSVRVFIGTVNGQVGLKEG